MTDHDDHSQGTLESDPARTGEGSNTVGSTVDSRVAACKKLVDEAVEKDLPATELANSLKRVRLKAHEAMDYIEEFN